MVIYDRQLQTQRFYTHHDDDITCFAVHPNGVICASGQVGRAPSISIWDSGAAAWENTLPPEEGGPVSWPQTAEPLGDLDFHQRSIDCLDFSHDGRLLVSVGGEDSHMVGIWDWQEGGKTKQQSFLRVYFFSLACTTSLTVLFCIISTFSLHFLTCYFIYNDMRTLYYL